MESKPIVLLTSGIYRLKDGKWKSDLDAHVTYSAGAELYNQNKGLSKIVVCGGKINGDENPVLSDVMKGELVRSYGISEKDIYTERTSVDTSENAENCGKLFDELGWEKEIFLVTRGYHMSRSKKLFHEYGFGVEEKIAEDVLKGKSEKLKGLLEDFEVSWPYIKKSILNTGLELALFLPNKMGEKMVRNYVHKEIDEKGKRSSF